MKHIDNIFEKSCIKGYLELVKICIEEGVNIHDYNDWALRESVSRNHYNIVKLLLENGANPYGSRYYDQDAFFYAEYYKRTEIASLLKQYR